MDVKKYIESGVLEAYATGTLSEQERIEVETHLENYPELIDELRRIEKAIEAYASQQTLTPGSTVYDAIIQTIKNDKAHQQSSPPPTTSNGTRMTSWLWKLFGAFALLFGLYFLNQDRLCKKTVREHQIIIDSLTNKIKRIENTNRLFANQSSLINDQHTTVVDMKGLPIAPDAFARIYYNPIKESTLIDLSDMPAVQSGKQFQLWALVDGSPVNMGVIPLDANQRTGLLSMTFVPDAVGFAVTIEPLGGQATPSLDQMLIYGEI